MLPRPVHPSERHHDDPGGGHVPGVRPDPHRHGHQRGPRRSAPESLWTLSGRRSPGGWFFLGLGLMVLGVTNLVLYAGLVLVVAGPLITGKGLGKITGIFGSPLQPHYRILRRYPLLLPSHGPDAGRVGDCSGVQHPGGHPGKCGDFPGDLSGGQRPELCFESAGVLRPRPAPCSVWSSLRPSMWTREGLSAP